MADKAPIAGQKIKRKFMGNFIDSALPGTKETAYVRLGKDLEEYNVEMNANVDTKHLKHTYCRHFRKWQINLQKSKTSICSHLLKVL